MALRNVWRRRRARSRSATRWYPSVHGSLCWNSSPRGCAPTAVGGKRCARSRAMRFSLLMEYEMLMKSALPRVVCVVLSPASQAVVGRAYMRRSAVWQEVVGEDVAVEDDRVAHCVGRPGHSVGDGGDR